MRHEDDNPIDISTATVSESPMLELAPMWRRSIAFGMDMALVVLVTTFFLTQFWMPIYYPEASAQLIEVADAVPASELILTERQEEMVAYGNLILMALYWLYFTMSEVYFRGSSLGKKVFNLRVVSALDGSTPSLGSSILRSMVKTVALTQFFPVVFFVNFFISYFTQQRKAGHDFAGKTCVIQE